MHWLVYGAKGWIGQQVVEYLKKIGQDVIEGKSRIDNEQELEQEISDLVKEHDIQNVISVTGRTSGPGFNSIDYLEQKGKLRENIRDNLYGPFCLAMISYRYGLHYTYLGTGCIFNYDKEPEYSTTNIGFSEDDAPNFFGSSYSIVKGFTDRMTTFWNHVLNVRIRMPITAEKHPKNFITKIAGYEKICSMKNSMTVLPDLIPVMIDMAKKKAVGTVNLVNPGVISHNEILDMYTDIVDPSFKYNNMTLEEQDKLLLCKRSNNALNTAYIEEYYPSVPAIKEAVHRVLVDMVVGGGT